MKKFNFSNVQNHGSYADCGGPCGLLNSQNQYDVDINCDNNNLNSDVMVNARYHDRLDCDNIDQKSIVVNPFGLRWFSMQGKTFCFVNYGGEPLHVGVSMGGQLSTYIEINDTGLLCDVHSAFTIHYAITDVHDGYQPGLPGIQTSVWIDYQLTNAGMHAMNGNIKCHCCNNTAVRTLATGGALCSSCYRDYLDNRNNDQGVINVVRMDWLQAEVSHKRMHAMNGNMEAKMDVGISGIGNNAADSMQFSAFPGMGVSASDPTASFGQFGSFPGMCGGVFGDCKVDNGQVGQDYFALVDEYDMSQEVNLNRYRGYDFGIHTNCSTQRKALRKYMDVLSTSGAASHFVFGDEDIGDHIIMPRGLFQVYEEDIFEATMQGFRVGEFATEYDFPVGFTYKLVHAGTMFACFEVGDSDGIQDLVRCDSRANTCCVTRGVRGDILSRARPTMTQTEVLDAVKTNLQMKVGHFDPEFYHCLVVMVDRYMLEQKDSEAGRVIDRAMFVDSVMGHVFNFYMHLKGETFVVKEIYGECHGSHDIEMSDDAVIEGVEDGNPCLNVDVQAWVYGDCNYRKGTLFQKCEHNARNAMVHRLLAASPQFMVDRRRWNDFCAFWIPKLFDNQIPTTLMGFHHFTQHLTNKKVRPMLTELDRENGNVQFKRKHGYINSFIKREFTPYKANGVFPTARAISATSLTMNAATGPAIYTGSKFMAKVWNYVQNSSLRNVPQVTYASGHNMQTMGGWKTYVDNTQNNPQYFESDYSKFDRHQNFELLAAEQSAWNYLFPNSNMNALLAPRYHTETRMGYYEVADRVESMPIVRRWAMKLFQFAAKQVLKTAVAATYAVSRCVSLGGLVGLSVIGLASRTIARQMPRLTWQRKLLAAACIVPCVTLLIPRLAYPAALQHHSENMCNDLFDKYLFRRYIKTPKSLKCSYSYRRHSGSQETSAGNSIVNVLAQLWCIDQQYNLEQLWREEKVHIMVLGDDTVGALDDLELDGDKFAVDMLSLGLNAKFLLPDPDLMTFCSAYFVPYKDSHVLTGLPSRVMNKAYVSVNRYGLLQRNCWVQQVSQQYLRNFGTIPFLLPWFRRNKQRADDFLAHFRGTRKLHVANRTVAEDRKNNANPFQKNSSESIVLGAATPMTYAWIHRVYGFDRNGIRNMCDLFDNDTIDWNHQMIDRIYFIDEGDRSRRPRRRRRNYRAPTHHAIYPRRPGWIPYQSFDHAYADDVILPNANEADRINPIVVTSSRISQQRIADARRQVHGLVANRKSRRANAKWKKSKVRQNSVRDRKKSDFTSRMVSKRRRSQ